jgi:hypothetical protein
VKPLNEKEGEALLKAKKLMEQLRARSKNKPQ